MRIGIDIRSLQTVNKFRGIGVYIKNLVENLLNIDSANEYILFTLANEQLPQLEIKNRNAKFDFVRLRRPKKLQKNSWTANWIFEQIFLPIEVFLQKVDIFHCTSQMEVPVIQHPNTFVTVHDLVQAALPGYYLKSKRARLWYFRRVNLIKKARRIIAVSNNTKKDIIKFLEIPAEKVEVVNEAADNTFHPIQNDETLSEIKVRFGINGKFLLYVGGFDVRKNLTILLKAFKKFTESISADIRLVVVGKTNGEGMRYVKLADDLGLQRKVIFTDFLPNEELNLMYNLAECLIFPSLYEGFGLPVLEAMACGTPVITSNVSSLPEIVGNAGILIDPYNIDAITQAICRVLGDEGFKIELGKKGLERAKTFSWLKTADKTLRIYHEVNRNSG